MLMILGSGAWDAGAFATWAAVVVALGASVLPPLSRRYWLRPRMTLECGTGKPFERVVQTDRHLDTFLRARVSNGGRRPANNVRVTVTGGDWLSGEELRPLDIDPFELHWIQLPLPQQKIPLRIADTDDAEWAVVSGPLESRIDLARGSADLVDVCRSYGGELILLAHDQRTRGFSYDIPLPEHETRLRVQITCDEADPQQFELSFRLADRDEILRIDDRLLAYSFADVKVRSLR